MDRYQPRKIAFRELLQMDQWSIKVYTIAKTGDFHHPAFYKAVRAQLPAWLALENSFNAEHERVAFLIVHSGTEGIFSLINWWVGTNMLNTHIFMTPREEPMAFAKISGDGLAPCIWELEVINHERLAWMQHVLKAAPQSDVSAYLSDVYNGTI